MFYMAKIVHSDAAPSGNVHYSIGSVEFDLGGRKKAFETDDADVLASAAQNPWLAVERDIPEVISGAYVEQLRPEDDHLSRVGAPVNPNDPDAVRAAEEAKASANINPVAIDAGLDQTEVVTVGPVSETVAAADKAEEESK